MASGGTPSIFMSDPTVKAVITLVLIENSQEMASIWTDMRGHYLPTLLGTMRVANPVVPIPILWLTTIPVGSDSSSPTAAPRQYNQLPDLKFSLQPDNRVSSRIVNRSIELMLEAALRFQGGPVSFHLIIVAASPPLEGTWGVSPTSTQVGQSEWQLVAQKLAQNKIHCHMILRSGQNMSSMEELFLSNMQLQNHESVPPWFPTSTEYSLYLSISRPLTRPRQMSSIVSGNDISVSPVSSAARPPVHRHQSFPLEAHRSSPEATIPGQANVAPSLVSSLQKIHGLSRKKLYGAQSARQPFVREEPVRAKYRQAPTPLSIPTVADDKHGAGKSRIRSPEGSSQASSPSDPISPGRRSPRNHRGMSPSDMRSIPAVPPPLSSPHGATSTPSIRSGPPGYIPMVHSTSFSPSLMMPPTTQAEYPGSGSGLVLMTPPACVPSQQPPSSAGLPTWNITPKYKDAGDAPFIFSPELAAASAAKLQAALQGSSFTQSSSFTSGNNYYTVDGVYSDAFPQQQPMVSPAQSYSYGACSLPPVASSSNASTAPILGGGSSSSLQGWAG